MVLTDADERILDVNDAFTKITGYSRAEAIGETPRVLKSGKHDDAFYSAMWKEIESRGIWKGEIINKNKEGKLYHEFLTVMKLVDEHNGETNYVSIFTDITPFKENEARFKYVATHDALTGLPNRVLLLDRITHAMQLCERLHKKIALIFIDLDNFKVINDSLGHDVGDQLLVEVSDRLQAVMRESDTVARLGGDEFVVLVESVESEQDVGILLQKITAAMGEVVHLQSRDFYPTASFGVTLYPDESTPQADASTLIRKADLAMYKSKEGGKNRISFYTDDLDERIQQHLEIAAKLVDALENGEFELFLQPKIDIANNTIAGAEALIRWKDGDSYIRPDLFIPIAEESDLIIRSDHWVCSRCIEILERWQEGPMAKLNLSVNISAKTFSSKTAMYTYKQLIRDGGQANRMNIELTESVLVENIDAMTKTLESLDKLGVAISLDDFGKGYSSFSYLSVMPFDYIKIDKSFVMEMENEKNRILVAAVISFSKELGIKVVAEGVETQEQLELLSANRCEQAQGYLFSKPLPLEDFETFCREWG
jgi:diguanylate cyclase (GGDEF)-like protein/PAS domain S-box-containing protein